MNVFVDLDPKAIGGGVVLALLWLLESWIPFYLEFPARFGQRLRHDLRNLALGLTNVAVTVLLFGGAFALLHEWGERNRFGLLRQVDWPPWASLIVALVLFDLWMYLWHRANHRIPFLWRFHRAHHSDPQVDASTGVRFHTGEIVLSSMARLLVVPLLGVDYAQLALYEAVSLPIVLFHHSNVRLPPWLDYGLLALVVTPAMHRVHHSRVRVETDSNYGSVFPWWDRLLRTFRLRDDAHTIALGLDTLDDPKWNTLPGILKTPLEPLPPDRYRR